MASGSINAHRPKVCMLAYCDSPTALPSMLNEGASLAGAGFEVESLCLASAATPPSEAHAPGFRTRRFPVRVREFFQGLLGFAPSGRRLAAVQRVLSYAEYVSRAFVHALKSGADLYAAHDLPPLLPTVLAAKLPLTGGCQQLAPMLADELAGDVGMGEHGRFLPVGVTGPGRLGP